MSLTTSLSNSLKIDFWLFKIIKPRITFHPLSKQINSIAGKTMSCPCPESQNYIQNPYTKAFSIYVYCFKDSTP